MKHYRIKNSQILEEGNFSIPPIINESKGKWLPVIDNILEYDQDTQVLQSFAEISETAYTISYSVRNKTALEMWDYPAFSKRIIAPASLIVTVPGVEAWARLNSLPIFMRGEMVYLYCNTILPEHAGLVEQYQEQITIENIPEN